MMRWIIQIIFRPYYSVAETLGIVVICSAFDLPEWLIAVPSLFVWLLLCGWVADRVRPA